MEIGVDDDDYVDGVSVIHVHGIDDNYNKCDAEKICACYVMYMNDTCTSIIFMLIIVNNLLDQVSLVNQIYWRNEVDK